MSAAKRKKITAEQKEARRTRARLRASMAYAARLEAECETRLDHYPLADRQLLLTLFGIAPDLTGMDGAVARLIRRNFTRCEPKVGWQEAARDIIARHEAEIDANRARNGWTPPASLTPADEE